MKGENYCRYHTVNRFLQCCFVCYLNYFDSLLSLRVKLVNRSPGLKGFMFLANVHRISQRFFWGYIFFQIQIRPSKMSIFPNKLRMKIVELVVEQSGREGLPGKCAKKHIFNLELIYKEVGLLRLRFNFIHLIIS